MTTFHILQLHEQSWKMIFIIIYQLIEQIETNEWIKLDHGIWCKIERSSDQKHNSLPFQKFISFCLIGTVVDNFHVIVRVIRHLFNNDTTTVLNITDQQYIVARFSKGWHKRALFAENYTRIVVVYPFFFVPSMPVLLSVCLLVCSFLRLCVYIYFQMLELVEQLPTADYNIEMTMLFLFLDRKAFQKLRWVLSSNYNEIFRYGKYNIIYLTNFIMLWYV